MTNVGDIWTTLRVATNGVNRDIQRSMSSSRRTMQREGETWGQAFTRGFERGTNLNVFRRFANGLRTMVPSAEASRRALASLIRTGYTLGTALSVVVGGISSVIGGLGALVGSAGAAIAALAAVGNAVTALGLGMIASKLALGGVGAAVSKLNKAATGGGGGGGGGDGGAAEAARLERIEDAEKNLARVIEDNRERLIDANNRVREAQLNLNKAIEEGREEIQQLGFDAEDAALSEQKASIDLEKAREQLARVQDLPPNSRARREAELAYQEAELNYRRAKDRSSDLNAEQDRLAQTGVAGTDAVISATEALAEAEADKARTVRDALRSQADAEDALADAKKKSASAGGGGAAGAANDWAEGLNDAQKKFALFIAGLKPQFDKLSEIAAEAFLPKLQTAIELLMEKAYPVVAKGIGQVAGAMGDASINMSEFITEAENLADLESVFSSSSVLIETMGTSLGLVYDVLLSILDGAAPQAQRFFEFLNEKLGDFSEHLDDMQKNNQLEGWFETAGDVAAKFGEIFGNIFEGVGAIIKANFSTDDSTGGGYLLNWLDRATQKFADLDNSPLKMQNLKDYFLDVAVNTQKVLSSFGALADEIIGVGRNPAIGKTFDILAGGADFVGNLLEKSINAGPVLGELVVQFTRFIDLMTDTGALEIFFGTLRDILTVINNILENDVIMSILTLIGRISAVGLAFGAVLGVAKFWGKAMVGLLGLVSNGVGLVIGAAGGTGFRGLNKVMGDSISKGAKMRGVFGSMGTYLGGPWMVALTAVIAALMSLNAWNDSTKSSQSAITRALQTSTSAADLLSTSVDTVVGDLDKFWRGGSNPAQKALTQNLGGVLDNLIDMRGSANDLKTAFRVMIDGTNTQVDKWQIGDSLRNLGTELGTLAQTNLPAAQDAFKNIADSYDLSRDQLVALLHEMPGFKEELANQAAQIGINIDDVNSLEGEQKLLNIAMGDAEDPVGKVNEKLAELSGVAYDADGSISDLANTIKGFGSGQIDANRAARDYNQQIRDNQASIEAQKDAWIDAHGTLKGFKADIDATTEAGSANQEMLDKMAESTLKNAAAIVQQTGDQKQGTAAIEAGRQALIDQMEQMGYTTEEAEAYADQLGLIPENINTVADLNTTQADKDAQKYVDRWDGKRIAMKVGLTGDGQPVFRINGTNIRFSKIGNLFDKGVAQSFANGGLPSGIFSGAQGPLYKFAEPETRWEAFISGKPGMETRNRAIVNDVADRLGMTPNVGNSSIVYNQTFNIEQQPGEDAEDLARRISRIISADMRMGATA